MKQFLFLFIVLTVSLASSAPRNPFPKTSDQIWQNDKDLTDDIHKSIGQVDALTLVQLRATAAKRIGKIFFCTTCATAALCVSTGTSVGQFSAISGKATACN